MKKKKKKDSTGYSTAMTTYPAGLNLGGEIVEKINK